jgi:hypothetical protein
MYTSITDSRPLGIILTKELQNDVSNLTRNQFVASKIRFCYSLPQVSRSELNPVQKLPKPTCLTNTSNA